MIEGLAAYRFRQLWERREFDDGNRGSQLVWNGLDPIPEETQRISRKFRRIHHLAAVHCRDRIQVEFQRRDHAKIAAPAAQTPEQIAVLGRAGASAARRPPSRCRSSARCLLRTHSAGTTSQSHAQACSRPRQRAVWNRAAALIRAGWTDRGCPSRPRPLQPAPCALPHPPEPISVSR